jgi:hypothetical protein
MGNILGFIDKWGFRVLFPLFMIMFFKTCSTNNNIKSTEKSINERISNLDSLINIANDKNFITEEEMVELIKKTPNWKTLELEELSDKDRIPINKLKNDEEK